MRWVSGRRRWVWWWLGGLAPMVVAVSAIVFFHFWAPHFLDEADKLASIGGLLVGGASLLASWLSLAMTTEQGRRGGTPEGGEDQPLTRAAAYLAEQLRMQWTEELAVRSLGQPAPLRLKWSLTDRPRASTNTVLGADRTEPLLEHGDLDEVVELFRRLPQRQLMVLGEPGAGKTVLALLFTLGLLGARNPDEPVPILLTASSWNPARERLETWFSRRLLEEYPGLADRALYGPRAAERLVRDGKVMPVLDGLDELPRGRHATALRALDRALTSGRSLVVTCRGAQYESAVARSGILAHMAVVEIEPVAVEAVIDYLGAALPAGDRRWEPVFDHLRRHRDGLLARVLSSPLMAYLARVAYTGPATDPTVLLDDDRFLSQAAIEHHLLEEYLPCVYPDDPIPQADTGKRAERAARWDEPGLARLWLTNLAGHLDGLGTYHFHWWELHRTLPRGRFELMAGLVAGVVTGLVAGSAAGLVFGAPFLVVSGCGTGLGVGMGAALVAGFRRRPAPSRVAGFRRRPASSRARFQIRRRARRLLRDVLLGVGVGLLAGGVFGVVFLIGADGGSHIARMAGVVAGVAGGLGVGLGAGLTSPVAADQHISPGSLLAMDRATALVQALGGGFCAGLAASFASAASSSSPSLGTALVAGSGVGTGVALVSLAGTAWGRWILIRTWLAAWGRYPWQLMDFLDDAHHRGVLRQVGGSYQFRHGRLQEHLLSSAPSASIGETP